MQVIISAEGLKCQSKDTTVYSTVIFLLNLKYFHICNAAESFFLLNLTNVFDRVLLQM